MKKILFFAVALAAGALAFTSCDNKDNNGAEPALIGKVYHYRGTSDVRSGLSYEHDVFVALQDNGKMTMKWVGVKPSEDAEPVTFYLYNGEWEADGGGGYYIHCDGTPQLPNGKPFSQWESFDIDGGCDETNCDFDYHINGVTGAIFTGEIVKEPSENPLVGTWEFHRTDVPHFLQINFTADYKIDFREYMEDRTYNTMEGTYALQGDIISAHFTRHGWNYGEGVEYIPDWEGQDEQMKYSIADSTLTLIRYYGTADEYTETYTKK